MKPNGPNTEQALRYELVRIDSKIADIQRRAEIGEVTNYDLDSLSQLIDAANKIEAQIELIALSN